MTLWFPLVSIHIHIQTTDDKSLQSCYRHSKCLILDFVDLSHSMTRNMRSLIQDSSPHLIYSQPVAEPLYLHMWFCCWTACCEVDSTGGTQQTVWLATGLNPVQWWTLLLVTSYHSLRGAACCLTFFLIGPLIFPFSQSVVTTSPYIHASTCYPTFFLDILTLDDERTMLSCNISN